MKVVPTLAAANVVNLPPVMKKTKGKVDDKWSPKVMKFGFTVLPNLLLQAQAKLKISPVQFNVLVQLFHHWWDADKYPFLSKETIATRIGKSPRQVQRYITELEKKGLVARQARFNGRKAQTSNIYSFEGLITKLKALEPEFAKAAEQARLKKKKLEAA
jgi:DNA-binding MarR family transcriptional regulator